MSEPKTIELLPHLPGSDYYGDEQHPGFTMWGRGGGPTGGVIIPALDRDTARRIQASYNACEGVTTHALERMALKNAPTVKLNAMCDALASALRGIAIGDQTRESMVNNAARVLEELGL